MGFPDTNCRHPSNVCICAIVPRPAIVAVSVGPLVFLVVAFISSVDDIAFRIELHGASHADLVQKNADLDEKEIHGGFRDHIQQLVHLQNCHGLSGRMMVVSAFLGRPVFINLGPSDFGIVEELLVDPNSPGMWVCTRDYLIPLVKLTAVLQEILGYAVGVAHVLAIKHQFHCQEEGGGHWRHVARSSMVAWSHVSSRLEVWMIVLLLAILGYLQKSAHDQCIFSGVGDVDGQWNELVCCAVRSIPHGVELATPKVFWTA